MFVYHFDPATLAYAGSSACEFDQLEPGRISAPAFATTKQPPTDWPMQVGMHPFYVPERDEWEMRELPKPKQEEPAAPSVDDLRRTFEAHMEAARAALAAIDAAKAQQQTGLG